MIFSIAETPMAMPTDFFHRDHGFCPLVIGVVLWSLGMHLWMGMD
jgi:hypothetical protein